MGGANNHQPDTEMQSASNDAKVGAAGAAGTTTTKPAEKSQQSFAGIMDFIKPDNDIFREMGISMPT